MRNRSNLVWMYRNYEWSDIHAYNLRPVVSGDGDWSPQRWHTKIYSFCPEEFERTTGLTVEVGQLMKARLLFERVELEGDKLAVFEVEKPPKTSKAFYLTRDADDDYPGGYFVELHRLKPRYRKQWGSYIDSQALIHIHSDLLKKTGLRLRPGMLLKVRLAPERLEYKGR